MSGLPGNSASCVSTRNPRRLKASANKISGLVPVVFCFFIREATPSFRGFTALPYSMSQVVGHFAKSRG